MHTDTYLLSIVWRDSYDTHSWAGEREGGRVRRGEREGKEGERGGKEGE